MMYEHETYPNAPLVAVIVEIRHPDAGTLHQAELAALRKALAPRLPISVSEQILELGAGAPPAPIRVNRFLSRDRHQSVVLKPTGIVVESTDYAGWGDFRPLVEDAVHARQDLAPVDGVERVGLRYIDEIRPPGGDLDWSHWISPHLLGPAALASEVERPLAAQQGIAQFGLSPNVTHTLRWATGAGQAYVSGENLRRTDELNGAFYLVDTDGAWVPPDGSVPEVNTSEIMGLLDELHEPIGRIFEATITERLREEVLRVTE